MATELPTTQIEHVCFDYANQDAMSLSPVVSFISSGSISGFAPKGLAVTKTKENKEGVQKQQKVVEQKFKVAEKEQKKEMTENKKKNKTKVKTEYKKKEEKQVDHEQKVDPDRSDPAAV